MTAGASQHLGTKSYNFDHVPGAKGQRCQRFGARGVILLDEAAEARSNDDARFSAWEN